MLSVSPLHYQLHVTKNALQWNRVERRCQNRAVMKIAVAVAAVPVLDVLCRGQESDRGEILRGPLHQVVLSGGKHQPTPQSG